MTAWPMPWELLNDPRRVTEIPPDQVPALLGELEELRAHLLTRLLSALAPNGRPEAPGRDRLLDVEEAAAYLLGIWRPELKDGLPKEKREEFRGQFKVRVLKNRSGPAPKTVTLHFEPTSLRISPAEPRPPGEANP